MITFSVKHQSFYDLTLNYPDVPNDLIEINSDLHIELMQKIASGCVVFSDLSCSEPRPTQFHTWNGSAWVDNRTQEEIEAHDRSLLPKISKRQFALYLFDHDMYDQVMQAIEANPRFKIEYDAVSDIERLSPTVASMTALLGWTDEQVDQMWTESLNL